LNREEVLPSLNSACGKNPVPQVWLHKTPDGHIIGVFFVKVKFFAKKFCIYHKISR
jgi:hypothetical protein